MPFQPPKRDGAKEPHPEDFSRRLPISAWLEGQKTARDIRKSTQTVKVLLVISGSQIPAYR